jgi:hypothetical protein
VLRYGSVAATPKLPKPTSRVAEIVGKAKVAEAKAPAAPVAKSGQESASVRFAATAPEAEVTTRTSATPQGAVAERRKGVLSAARR